MATEPDPRKGPGNRTPPTGRLTAALDPATCENPLHEECAFGDPASVGWGNFEECAPGTGAHADDHLTTYGYDDAGQVTSVAANGTLVEEYVYDDAGNRDHTVTYDPATGIEDTRVDYTVDMASRLDILEYHEWDGTGWDLVDTAAYSYDPAGRRLGIDRDGDDTTYGWDARGALTSITIGADVTTYTYNPDDTQATRTLNATSTTLLWDTTQRVAQNIEARSGYVTFHANYGHRPLQLSAGPPENAIHAWSSYDHRGSLTDNPQLIDLPTSYTTFGAPLPNHDHTGGGYRTQAHTAGHIYLRNRTYDPTTGTFLSPDPLTQGPDSPELTSGRGPFDGQPTVANPYHYVSNDPLNWTDPLGLCRTTDVGFRPDGSVYRGPDDGLSLEQCRTQIGVECIDLEYGPMVVSTVCRPDPEARHCELPGGATVSGDPEWVAETCARAWDPTPRPTECQEYQDPGQSQIWPGYPFTCAPPTGPASDISDHPVCRVASQASWASAVQAAFVDGDLTPLGVSFLQALAIPTTTMASITVEGVADLVLGACEVSLDYEPGERPPWLCPQGYPKPQNGTC